MHFLKPSEYLTKVNRVFDVVKKQINQILPGADVEHIGSSAIEGAISKGDLDILVRTSNGEFQDTLEKLLTLPFSIKQDTLRTESLCMLQSHEYAIDVAIQLIERGSKFEMFSTFRNKLSADLSLVEKYNELKLDSVGLSPEDYRLRKSKFIEAVLASL